MEKQVFQVVSSAALVLMIWSVAVFITASTAESSEKYALLIGINEYQGSGFKNLQGAIDDVELVKNVLSENFGFKEQNITVLSDKEASHTAIQSSIAKLTEKVKSGDIVYIHYSGHGSYTCDLNGDEESGNDSTWVSYGSGAVLSGTSGSSSSEPSTRGLSRGFNRGESLKQDCAEVQKSQKDKPPADRAALGEKLNNYDVLDDEIHLWLVSLCKKTDHVIFVSDSCHSGTVNRGEDALMTRGLPTDFRPHPLGTNPASKDSVSGVRVSACRDDEKASEYLTEESKTHGMFTWFWAKSLQEAKPDETWGDVYKQTCARIEYNGGRQHPQFEGEQTRKVFKGEFAEPQKTIPVKGVSVDGQSARIQAGTLLNVTKGSVYRKYEPGAKETDKLPTIEITETASTWSKGKADGAFKAGDLVVLEKYQYDAEAMKVFVRADLPADNPLAEKIKKAVGEIPAYQISGEQKQSRFVIQILRPKKDEKGNEIYENPIDSFPKSFADQPPECRIADASERLYHETLKITMKDEEKGIKLLCENLEKIARIQGMMNLTASTGQECPVQLEITVWNPKVANPNTDEIKEEEWEKQATVTAKEFEESEIKVGQMLTFAVHNQSDSDYYVYLIDMTDDGKIIPFYPALSQSSEAGKIGAGKSRKIESVTLLIDQPGKEYLRLIASREAIDIYLLEQKAFQTKGASKSLEEFLCIKAGYMRGKTGGGFAASAWATVQKVFKVSR